MNQFSQSFWTEKRVLVTGGSSFIGSHLVDKLVSLNSEVTVIDNLSSGTKENLSGSWEKISFHNDDLEYITKSQIDGLFKDIDIVFHLAAIHGGRGFITNHPADVSSNFSIDHHVFEACMNANVENLVFASTACVYPTKLQNEIGSDYKLKEEDSNPLNLDGFMSADIEYGWGKLMSEMQYDAATLGNHDFDNGLEGLKKQLPHANFPFLIASTKPAFLKIARC